MEDVPIIGLSGYESKVYNALVSYGPMDAKRISERAGVPKNRVYDTIQSLSRKGFIEYKYGVPKLYIAVNPTSVLGDKIDELEKLKEQLAKEYNERRDFRGVEETVYILEGLENAKNYRRRLLDSAQEEALSIIAPETTTEKVVSIDIKASRAKKRGVKCKHIENVNAKTLDKVLSKRDAGIDIRHHPVSGFTIHIVDRKEVGIEVNDPFSKRIIVSIKNKGFGRAMGSYFDTLWKEAMPLEKRLKELRQEGVSVL